MALLGAILGNSVTHADNHSAIKLEKDEGDKISVKIKGEHFTTYHYGKDRAKPILYPVLGPKNKRMVRDWPIKKKIHQMKLMIILIMSQYGTHMVM